MKAIPIEVDGNPAKVLRFTVQKAVPRLPDGVSIILNASIVARVARSVSMARKVTAQEVRS